MHSRTKKILSFSSNAIGFFNLSSNHLKDIEDYKAGLIDDEKRCFSFSISPTLFLFYHGLELLLKAYILLDGGDEKEVFGHNGKVNLILTLKKYRKPYKDKILFKLLDKYLSEEGEFFLKLRKLGYLGTPEKIYNDLRYIQNGVEYLDSSFWVKNELGNIMKKDTSTLGLKLVCRIKHFLKIDNI